MENHQLTLSPAKCQYLPIFRKPYNINHASEYHINCYNIPTTFSACDLGVVISSDLKWNNHISKIVAKASIGLYHISHSFNSNNILDKILQRLNLSKNNLLDTFAFSTKCHFLRTMTVYISLI